MPDFDDRWLDLDFDKQPEFTFGDLGPPEPGLFASYEDVYGVMSEREIREAIEAQDAMGGSFDLMVTRIFDQKQEGSCTCNALGQQREITDAEEVGEANVTHVSAISLYKQVARSASSGSNIGQAAKALQAVGMLPLDSPENKEKYQHTMPNTGFSKSFPQGWKETAALLRTDEYHVVNSYEGLLSASLHGPLVIGRDGHAICYVRLMFEKGRYVTKYANSWGNWGDNGFGYDSESKMKSAANYAVALRSTRVQKGKS